MTDLPTTLTQAVKAKQLQYWSSDPSLQSLTSSLLPSDSPPKSDTWTKIVNHNIGGMKSSRNTAQHVVVKRAVMSADFLRGASTESYSLTITRTHSGDGTFPDGPNTNYVEVYLPRNATILQLPENHGGTSGLIDSYPAPNWPYSAPSEAVVEKTDHWKRIGFWMSLAVGESRTTTLSYSLPISASPLLYLKQSGTRNETLTYVPVNERHHVQFDVNENLVIPR